jgi:osmoprotectant transport system permease protein
MLTATLEYIVSRSQDFTTALSQHLSLTFVSLAISAVLGLLLGVTSARVRWLRSLVLGLANLGRTIPSLAVLALALPFLGIGQPPTTLALVVIGTLPILINAHVGIREVDDAVIEAARGMGMNELEILWQIELPLAAPVIMAGIRTSAVLVVADATLAAFIGGGGLGDLILRGHALNRDDIVLAGAVPATLLALYFEEVFGRLEAWATPRGLKPAVADLMRPAAEGWGLLLAMLFMPLVFGILLPWDSYADEAGAAVILTGIHPAFRWVGVPILLLGMVAALKPSSEWGGHPRLALAVTSGLVLVGWVWLVAAALSIVGHLPAGHTLQSGFFLQAGAMAAILAVSCLELAGALKSRRRSSSRHLAVGMGGV